MNHIRLIEIINVYGTYSEKWPHDEREAATELLKSDLEAQTLIKNVKSFDLMLDEYRIVDKPNLSAKILSNLPKKPWLDRLIYWVLPSLDGLISHVWRPILAGSLPLIVGLIVGNSFSTAEILDSWEDEILLVSLATSNTGDLYE